MISVDFSIFLNPSTIIFFVICFIILIIFLVICFIIIKFIFNLLKKIFIKEQGYGARGDKGEDLEVRVGELEESKKERQKIEQQRAARTTTAGPTVRYSQPVASNQKKEELEVDKKQKWEEKNQKDEDNNTPVSKIEIPVAKRFNKENPVEDNKKTAFQLGSNVKIPVSQQPSTTGGPTLLDNQPVLKGQPGPDQKKEDGAAPGPYKASVIQANRTEELKKSDIKVAGESVQQSPADKTLEVIFSPVLPKEKKASSSKVAGKVASNTKEVFIFGGKEEVSRIDLRQKLRKDPKIWKAEMDVGLRLSPAERAKLEKEVFSQSYGRNISKTDLKWGIKKLNNKMLSTKNLAEKGKLQKEIKFFKKIGGV